MTTNGRTKDGNNPRSVQRFQRAILIGIPSADFIKASGHSTARQAGHMEATDQVISTSKKPLPAGAIHIWTLPGAEVVDVLESVAGKWDSRQRSVSIRAPNLSRAIWICGLIKRGVTLDFSTPGKSTDNAFLTTPAQNWRIGADTTTRNALMGRSGNPRLR